jgi:hypothetical protein
MSNYYTKDPDAVLDYVWDWIDWLADGEHISTSTFSATSGVTLNTPTHTTTNATVWVSGGTAGVQYTVTNRIITDGGRTDDRSITINVRPR